MIYDGEASIGMPAEPKNISVTLTFEPLTARGPGVDKT